jgi:hypothetical protein
VTILWQTDEVRSRRPRVVDEIRHGLWFVEASLWQALPRLVRELREADPGAPPPTAARNVDRRRSGRQSARGGGDDHSTRSSAHARSARDLLPATCAARVAWGMSTELVGPVPELDPASDEPYSHRARARSGRRLAADGLPRRRGASRDDLARVDSDASRARCRARSPTARSPISRHVSSCSACTWRRSTFASMRRTSGRRREHIVAAFTAGAEARERHGPRAIDRVIVSMTASAGDVLAAETLARGAD